MEFTKVLVVDEDKLVGAVIDNIGIINGNSETFLVINTNKGIIVYNEVFDAIIDDVLDEMIMEFAPEDLFDTGLIDEERLNHLETINEFELDNLSNDELEELHKVISVMLKK